MGNEQTEHAAEDPFLIEQSADMVTLVEAFGFRRDRTSGSHHIFVHPDIPELVNLQDRRGKAKPYQVRQFLDLVELHDLQMEDDA